MKFTFVTRLLLAALFTLSLVGRTADSPDPLQPLKYNHPGLVVDLGVGLWAWPMPLDYNRDGKMDLLVACPDKPSNGVWFFENTGEPDAKLPIFKPGVSIGPATHNLQVSYVRGEPRILGPASEHENFRESKFAQPRRIYPRPNIHPNQVRANLWRYVDYEGNGVHDLLVGVGDWSEYAWANAYDAQGRWRNGPLHGLLYLIEYRGTDAARVISGSPDGVSYFRVRHLEPPGPWSAPVRVEVRHHGLLKALGFFGVGALVFLSTVTLIVIGGRRQGRGHRG